MTELKITKTGNQLVRFDGAGEYFLVKSMDMWVKARDMAAINLEKKNNRQVIHMDTTTVKSLPGEPA